jgi:hypothetical protein
MLINLSLFFFAIFVVILLVNRTASGKSSYRKVNTLHRRIYLAYLLCSFTWVAFQNSFSIEQVINFLLASFLYYSLHYVYVFSLIGLLKKSISVNVLSAFETFKSPISLEELTLAMSRIGVSPEFISKDRIEQLQILKMARGLNGNLQITGKGRRISLLRSIILRLWNLEQR